MLTHRGSAAAIAANEPRETLIGSSEAMRAVQKAIGMLADSNATVLITGETGTGKELVARAIHDYGTRRSASFVAVNCASIPSELMESELFGHVRGAFTGAVSERTGAFRQADGGTLFLDEIGDMESSLQAKILRALQERVITPIGGKAVNVDVRVIAATHRDLTQRVRDGAFREDLYYRLHVVPIHLPPLRARIADILPLAEYFLSQAASGKRLSADAAARLIHHAWPGNVRELKNTMERAAVLVRGECVSESDLSFLDETPGSSQRLDWPDEDLPTAIAHLEELLIRRALGRAGGNRAEAARLLNINRQLLYAKLKRYGLEVSEDTTGPVGEADSER
jgi:two-component system NtrC family response regulator